MDLTIEHRRSEEDGKKLWRKAFFAFAAPGYVLGVIYILICIVIGLQNEGWRSFLFAFATIVGFANLIAWPRTWRMYREIFQRQGAFKQPTVIRLTDSFIETSCGENHSKQEYSLFTHYFCLKDCIVLIHKNSIMCIIQKKSFWMAAGNGYPVWRTMAWRENVFGA